MMRRISFCLLFLFICALCEAQVIAYVPNMGSGTLSVINTNTNSLVANVPVGINPIGISVSSDGSRAYVANNGSNTVSVINTANNSVIATVPVGGSPIGISVSPNGSRVYVANTDDFTVSVINTSTNTVIATIPVGTSPIGISVSPDGSRVYVCNGDDNNVAFINTATNTVVATVGVGLTPWGISVSPDGSRLYVTNENDNTVSVVNTITNSLVATVNVGTYPQGIAVSTDGSRVYAANYSDNTVSVINTATNTVVATIPVGSAPDCVSVSPNGSTLFVTNVGSNNMSVINRATNVVVGTIAAVFPVGLGNMLSLVYNTNSPSASISYAGSPFCQIGQQSVTRTGPGGGTYSSTTGLAINSVTGLITPAASTPGTYTVTYTYAGGITTTTVTINPTPTITGLATTAAPVCPGASSTTVNFTGTTNSPVSYQVTASPNNPMPNFDPYIAPMPASGNSLNIALPVTAPGGTYEFIVKAISASGCQTPGGYHFKLTVLSPTSTTISYPTPLCQTGNTTPTRTGAAGGTYSSTTGLSIDPIKGFIFPAASTPGNYTVTYTVTTAQGCVFTATAPVTIIASPKITTGSATPVCVGTSGAMAFVPYTVTQGTPVTYDLTAGATNPVPNFVPVTGATLTPNNIEVDIPGSTPGGTYYLYLTLKTSGGCTSARYTIAIKVLGSPTATVDYPSNPYYTSVNSEDPNFSGATGGTFTASPAGLHINSLTGRIYPSTSTPGTYTVSYTVTTTCTYVATAPVVIFQPSNRMVTATKAKSEIALAKTNSTVSSSETVAIAPNPVHVMLSVRTANSDPMSVMVLTATGKTIVNPVRFTSATTIDMSPYASGFYQVEVVNERTGEVVRKKIIKD